MELLVAIIAFGLISIFNILGYRRLDKTVRQYGRRTIKRVGSSEKKTQQEVWDVKNRLTWSKRREVEIIRLCKKVIKHFTKKK